ncbi:MAG: hypothetical protein Q9160_000530 [Pyrenula sp. 1 TL-2023]
MAAIYAIHVRTLPPPTTYAKSRAILNALQQFGRVNSFLSLRYFQSSKSPNTSLAIFESEESFRRALDSSPLYVAPLGSESGAEDEMVCELSISRMDHVRNARYNQYSGTFSVDRQSMSYHDLTASGAPLDEYADCAVVDKPRLSSVKREKSSNHATTPYGSLMDMWRHEGRTDGPGDK